MHRLDVVASISSNGPKRAELLLTTRGHHPHFIDHDLLRGRCDCHQRRRALPNDRLARDRRRQTGRETRADCRVVDLINGDARPFDGRSQGIDGHAR